MSWSNLFLQSFRSPAIVESSGHDPLFPSAHAVKRTGAPRGAVLFCTVLKRGKVSPNGAPPVPAFDAQAFLDAPGIAKGTRDYGRGETIFMQGDPCLDVQIGRA